MQINMTKHTTNFVVAAALCLSSSTLYAQSTIKGKVIDELEKGYTLNDKVVRFAKVVVGA